MIYGWLCTSQKNNKMISNGRPFINQQNEMTPNSLAIYQPTDPTKWHEMVVQVTDKVLEKLIEDEDFVAGGQNSCKPL